MTFAIGTWVGPYEILSPLGLGGMGEVYCARDNRLNREVAIKVLPASFSNDADRFTRFEQEGRATSALNHPNILTVHDFGTHDSSPNLVAELLEGVRGDGQRFLIITPGGEAAAQPLTVVLNWTADLKR